MVGLAWLLGYRWRDLIRAGLGALLIGALVVLWEIARTGGFSLWSAQVGNYGGVRQAWSWELFPRLSAWWGLAGTVLPPLLIISLLLLCIFMIGRGYRGNPLKRIDLLWVIFLVYYLALHWLLAIPVWDRYLLPLVPVMGILLGRGLMVLGAWGSRHLGQPRPSWVWFFLVTLLLLLMVPGSWAARESRYPVGGQLEADHGAAAIATHLADAPYGTVLYDHWYSWQWRYHLFDKAVFVSWFPHLAAFEAELLVFGQDEHQRFLVLPDDERALPVQRVVERLGFRLQLVANEGNILLFEILPAEVTGDN